MCSDLTHVDTVQGDLNFQRISSPLWSQMCVNSLEIIRKRLWSDLRISLVLLMVLLFSSYRFSNISMCLCQHVCTLIYRLKSQTRAGEVKIPSGWMFKETMYVVFLSQTRVNWSAPLHDVITEWHHLLTSHRWQSERIRLERCHARRTVNQLVSHQHPASYLWASFVCVGTQTRL